MKKHERFALLILALGLLACSASVDLGTQPTPTLYVIPTQPPTALPNFPTPTPQSGGGQGQGTALPPGAEHASVVYVIDGDTIDVSIAGADYRVRYVGINTPERDEPCYQEATDANRALVEDEIVTLVPDISDTDDYGRLLRYVYVGDVFVNAALVRDGWAEARRYAPDTTQYDLLDNFEAVAASAGIGCWSSGVFER
jgi:micrococcal nuclease